MNLLVTVFEVSALPEPEFEPEVVAAAVVVVVVVVVVAMLAVYLSTNPWKLSDESDVSSTRTLLEVDWYNVGVTSALVRDVQSVNITVFSHI